jgi:hypothetical protein
MCRPKLGRTARQPFFWRTGRGFRVGSLRSERHLKPWDRNREVSADAAQIAADH